MKVFPAYTPNDPYMTYASAWHHTKIGSRTAWDTTKGDGITIAVLDSGVNCNHQDLKANCVPGWNTMSNSSDTSDINGHGTYVAGTIASVGDNALGGAGVAYQAKIMPIRLSDSSDGSTSCSAIANGLTYAADNGARVASNSYYIYGCYVVNSAAKYLESKGGLYIRAAGNFAQNEDSNVPEGNVPEITIVSATDQNDAMTSFSSWGAFVDVSAPGIGVYCTNRSGGYNSCWGTSFSVPITSGIYALMFSVNPALTPTQAKNILYSTTDDLGTPGWDMYYGHGRVNAAKAVAAAAAAVGARDTVPPSTPTNLRVTSVSSNSVSLAWNASTDDNSGVAGYTIYRDGTKLATIAGTSYTSTGLSPNTTYAYTVMAEDGAGNVSSTTAPLSVTTPDISLGISSYSVSNKTNTTATINATLTKSGTVTVKYGTTNTNLNLTAESNTTNTTHAVSLSGLTANTTYYYQIVATDGTTTITAPVSSFKTAKGGGGGGGKPKR
jgi:subtilisin family serine protease